MFEDMMQTIKAKYIEMILFVPFYVLGNTVYFGYFRPQDIFGGIIFSFLIYIIWGYYMRNFGHYSPFMTQRESWTLSQSIVDNKWMFGLLIGVFTTAWYTNLIAFSIPMYVFFMLYSCVMAIMVDKARYL